VASTPRAAIPRSQDLILAGFYLSLGSSQNDGLPPKALAVERWQRAYAMFYRALGAGRTLRGFSNTLKNCRDAFDAHHGSGRIGWRALSAGDAERPPKQLSGGEQSIWDRWRDRPLEDVWNAIRDFVSPDAGQVPEEILADLAADDTPLLADVRARTEGDRLVVLSFRSERDPALRAAALRLHGLACVVCGFDFEARYGPWGAGFAEVHHVVPLSAAGAPRETNPLTDLAVVCANCHRMIHRRRGRVLSVSELAARLLPARDLEGNLRPERLHP
jgi:5-methylcytosine-specific restriction protein A